KRGQIGVVMDADRLMRAVMNANDSDLGIVEDELVILRIALERVLRRSGKGETHEKHKRTTAAVHRQGPRKGIPKGRITNFGSGMGDGEVQPSLQDRAGGASTQRAGGASTQ